MHAVQVSEKEKNHKSNKQNKNRTKVKYIGIFFSTMPYTHGAVYTKQFILIASLLLYFFLDF